MFRFQFTRTVSLIAFVLPFIIACQDDTKSPESAASAAQAKEQILAQEHLKATRRECTETLERRKADYKQLMTAKKYWEASLELRTCAGDLDDAALKALVADAEIKSHLQILAGTTSSYREKLQAAEMLVRDYPEYGKKYEPSLSKLKTQADAQDRAMEAAAKKKRGVSIGMSTDEVVSSSWGKPESINRTINSYGTQEQWVYGSRSYLYFENGKLVSIQN
jgi:hypothetical protein